MLGNKTKNNILEIALWAKGYNSFTEKSCRQHHPEQNVLNIPPNEEHDMKCVNASLQTPYTFKALFKPIAADNETEPWTADRYVEIYFCLAQRRWADSINNVYTDPFTNVHTDRKSVIVKINQKLKALETVKPERSFKGFQMPEDHETEFNNIIKTQQGEHERESEGDMHKFMKSIAVAAEQTMPDNRGVKRKQD